MIDLHTHILPGVDDGPATTEAALGMAHAASVAGTRAMATTPHINHGFGVQPAGLASAREALADRLAEEGIELELLAGGEIAPERLQELDDDVLRTLALGGGHYVLLECPFSAVAGMEMMVTDLHRRGFGVLLGHPERSPTFQRDPARLAALIELGALAQVTTGSFTGNFGEVPRRAAAAMLEQGLLHVLASDAHDEVHRRPDLHAADGVLDEAQVEWMTATVPAAIVAGGPLPDRPPLPPAGGTRARLRSWSTR
jgi:protein-tyrosine phosphatase